MRIIEVIALLTTASNTIRDRHRTSKARNKKKSTNHNWKERARHGIIQCRQIHIHPTTKAVCRVFLLCFLHFSSHSFSSSFIQFSLNCFLCYRDSVFDFFFRFFAHLPRTVNGSIRFQARCILLFLLSLPSLLSSSTVCRSLCFPN